MYHVVFYFSSRSKPSLNLSVLEAIIVIVTRLLLMPATLLGVTLPLCRFCRQLLLAVLVKRTCLATCTTAAVALSFPPSETCNLLINQYLHSVTIDLSELSRNHIIFFIFLVFRFYTIFSSLYDYFRLTICVLSFAAIFHFSVKSPEKALYFSLLSRFFTISLLFSSR